MPFGIKQDALGQAMDFDAIYQELFKPAIELVGMQPIRAGELIGGFLDKADLTRLILAECVLVDVTTASPDVMYCLGVRHAARPRGTVLAAATGTRVPPTVSLLRVASYRISEGSPGGAAGDIAALRKALDLEQEIDSPVFQLLYGYQRPNIDALEDPQILRPIDTSIVRRQIAAARGVGTTQVDAVRDALGPLQIAENGLLVDLLLAYRATKAWGRMIDLVNKMPVHLSRHELVRQQLAIALRHEDRSEEAEQLLITMISEGGPSSESLSILGDVYRDRWGLARQAGDPATAEESFRLAIAAYMNGFRSDFRDSKPGLRALALLQHATSPDPRCDKLLPVVAFAIESRVDSGNSGLRPGALEYVALLELAILQNDAGMAIAAQSRLLGELLTGPELDITHVREALGDAIHNIELVLEARQRARNVETWMLHVEETLRAQRGEALRLIAAEQSASSTSQAGQRSVFVSYSHEDIHWLGRLKVHLKPQVRAGELDLWDDTVLVPGSQWREEIRAALENATVAVLLVSADFLASDFIASDELPPLLDGAQYRGVKVLPLIVSPCRFKEIPSLAKFQSVNDSKLPLVMLDQGEQEQVFVSLANQIGEILQTPP